MRWLPSLACLLLLLLPAPARAAGTDGGTGGAAAPSAGGGTTFAQPLDPVRRWSSRPSRPVPTVFAVTPARLAAGGTATFAYRVDAPARRVRARIVLRPAAGGAPVRLGLGRVRTGRRHEHAWTPGTGELAAGTYAVALFAVDPTGRALRRTAKASGRGRLTITLPPPPPDPAPAAPPAADGVFPVAGPYSFGGAESRFGADRHGHVHQGQDVAAAAGTPLVAPVDSTVTWIDFQRGGAGQYVVLRGGDGTDYVFMHLVRGSVTVAKGAALAAGEPFGQVGSTGSSSGAHLHFELWPDGWYATKASRPVDPLPQLQAWAAGG